MNENDFYSQERQIETTGAAETLGRYTAKAFLWMFIGLAVTFGVAMGGYATGAVFYLFSIPYIHIIMLVAELAVVLVLASRIHKLSVGAARGLFLAYAVLTGIVFSAYFLIFEVTSMVLVFAVTALYFGVMAVFGYFTSMDLSRIRNILVGGLLFLIVFGILSMFIPFFGAMERLYCIIGIVIFLAFTAYDTQKIKAFYYGYAGDEAMLSKASIFSALQLYLDFINLFLYLLRFLGKRRN